MNFCNDIKEKINSVGNKWNVFWGSLQHLGIFQRTLIVLALFMMITIWPMGLYSVEHVSSGNMDGTRYSTALTEVDVARQEFAPNYETLNSISVYVANSEDSVDTMEVAFRLYNRVGVCLLEYFFNLADIEFPGYVTIPINMDLVPGELYFYTVGGRDGELITLFCNDSNKTPENGAMYYKEVVSGGTSILTRYNYSRDMGLKRLLFFDAIIGFLCFGLIAGIQLIRNSIDEDKWKKSESICKNVLCVLVGIGAIIVLYALIISKLFAQDALNIVVLALGVVLLAICIGLSIWRCPSDYTIPENSERELKKVLTSFVRSLLWAAAIIFCCLHTNAMTNYEKGLFMRCLLTAIGLIFVSYSKKREIFNLPNFIWTVLAIPIGRIYISFHSDHIEHINTATRDAFVIWAIGLIVINLCYVIRKERLKACKNIFISYTIVVFAFMILCVIFAQGKQWPTVLVVVALLLGFKLIIYSNPKQVLEEICNGTLLAFAGTTCFCVCRRAYQYYYLYRYGGVYATVTANAVYLCAPMAAAFVKVTEESNPKKRLKWYGVLGVVISYMIFTASRTGLLALTGCLVFYLVYPYKGREKWWLIRNIKYALSGFVIIGMTFISTFTVTRMLPAVVGNPYYFAYESQMAFMTEETPWSGYEYGARYMTIERVFDILFERTTVSNHEAPAEGDGDVVAVSADMPAVTTNADSFDDDADYTNGRLEIYSEYISRLNMQGHSNMGIELENGEYLYHAHNSYLQVMHDFGIPVGIVYLIVCLWTFIRSCRVAYFGGKVDKAYTLPMYMVVAFGLASVAEWTYYLTIPLGFLFIIMMVVVCDKCLLNKQ